MALNSFIHRIGGGFKAFSEYVKATNPNAGLYSSSGKWPDVNQQDLIRRYVHWSGVCAKRNAEAVSGVPLRLYATRGTGQSKARYGKKVHRDQMDYLRSIKGVAINPRFNDAEEVEEIYDHPFLTLMQDVNESTDGTTFMQLTVTHYDLCGNSYWYVDRHETLGTPRALWTMFPQITKVMPGTDTWIKGYAYGAGGGYVVEPTDAVHFKGVNPMDPYYGAGCLQLMVRAHDHYTSQENYEQALTDNMARPDLWLQYKTGPLTPKKKREVETDWNSKFRGSHRAGKVMVGDHEWDLKEVGYRPADIAALQVKKWTRTEISGAFGVPVAYLDSENVNKANAEAAATQHARLAVVPRCRMIEDKINSENGLLKSYGDGDRLFVAYDNPVPEDKDSELKRRDYLAKYAVFTPDELRALENKGPLDEYGDEPLVQNNRVPLSVAVESMTARNPQPPPAKSWEAYDDFDA